MLTIAVKCPYCGAVASSSFGQSVRGFNLQWWESFSCPACGRCTQLDGDEDLPQKLRKMLLEQQGSWCVVTAEPPTLGLLRAARECLKLSLSELPALKARLPGALATGTRSEMEVLVRRLHRTGGAELPVKVVPAESSVAADQGP